MKTPLMVTPLDSFDDAEKLVASGAGEFYCGIIPAEWQGEYAPASIDRRPRGQSHFESWESVSDTIATAHRLGAKVNIAINEHYYTAPQYELIDAFIKNAVSAKADSLIISDPALIFYIKENEISLKTHLSTGGVCLNCETALFFRDTGVSRIILPRHLTIKEIEKISAIDDIEFETFVFNSRCVNIDGLCTFQHGLSGAKIENFYRNACMLSYDVQTITKQETDERKKMNAVKRQKIWESVHIDDFPCGACSLFEFSEAEISAVKIVGRGNDSERKIKDLQFFSKLKSLIEEGMDKKTFRKETSRLYRELYERECRYHMCYYPEAMS